MKNKFPISQQLIEGLKFAFTVFFIGGMFFLFWVSSQIFW